MEHTIQTRLTQGYPETMLVATNVSPLRFLALHVYFPKSMVSMSTTVMTLWEMRVVRPTPLFTSLFESWTSTGRWPCRRRSMEVMTRFFCTDSHTTPHRPHWGTSIVFTIRGTLQESPSGDRNDNPTGWSVRLPIMIHIFFFYML